MEDASKRKKYTKSQLSPQEYDADEEIECLLLKVYSSLLFRISAESFNVFQLLIPAATRQSG
jgi:hypothetical protein